MGWALPQGPHDGHAVQMGPPEQGVEVGQKGVALANGSPHTSGVGLPEQPGLAPLRVQVAVAPEERGIGSQLPPPHRQFRLWVAEKASHIRTYVHKCSLKIETNQNITSNQFKCNEMKRNQIESSKTN